MLSLQDFKPLVDTAISETYTKAASKGSVIDPLFGQLFEEMRVYITRGGKRLRPYLAYVAYTGMGGADTKAIIATGALLEIYHNFLLIHDDIIDRDLVRYGGPNIEGAYFHKLHKSAAHNAQFGAIAAAILAGDLTTNLAQEICYDLPISDGQKIRLLRALSDTTFVVAGGEFIDSLGSVLSHSPLSTEQISEVYRNKTGYYTFFLPLRLAAILTDRDHELEQMLHELAIPIGMAYQMRDDYLGLFGDPEKTGKPITSDVREGKQTFYYSYMQQLASDQDRVELENIYGNPQATEREVHRVREICDTCGATEKVEHEIALLHQQALARLDQLPFSEAASEIFRALFTLSVQRND